MKNNQISIQDLDLFTELSTDEQVNLVGGACSATTPGGTVVSGTTCTVLTSGTVVVKATEPITGIKQPILVAK